MEFSIFNFFVIFVLISFILVCFSVSMYFITRVAVLKSIEEDREGQKREEAAKSRELWAYDKQMRAQKKAGLLVKLD